MNILRPLTILDADLQEKLTILILHLLPLKYENQASYNPEKRPRYEQPGWAMRAILSSFLGVCECYSIQSSVVDVARSPGWARNGLRKSHVKSRRSQQSMPWLSRTVTTIT